MGKKLIKELADLVGIGKIAIKNIPRDEMGFEYLCSIMEYAFPNTKTLITGVHKFYFKSLFSGWACGDELPKNMDAIPLMNFFIENDTSLIGVSTHEFKRGDLVEVRDSKSDVWRRRIYLTTIEGSQSPYYCVAVNYEMDFMNNAPFKTVNWKFIRSIPIKKVDVSFKEIATWKGCNPEQISIIN